MTRADVDALLLGREESARFALGVRRLWTAGTRPYAPVTTIVGATGDVYMMSTYDEGVPVELSRENMYALTWNPLNIAQHVGSIPGSAGWRRVGIDGMTPIFAALLGATLPEAEYVDAGALLREARAHKSADELVALRTSSAIAEAALSAGIGGVRPGVSTGALQGAMERRRCDLGVPPPAMAPAAQLLDSTPGADRHVDAGARIYLEASAQFAGYVGVVGRTVECAQRGDPGVVFPERIPARDALLGALRPGASAADLLAAGADTEHLLVMTIGLGFVGVVVDGDRADTEARLAAGTALFVRAEAGGGRLKWADTLLVTSDGAEVLTTLAAARG